MEKSICFLESTVFVVQVPVLKQGQPEVKIAKVKEMQNLAHYETFKEVEDVGQEHIGNHWVSTRKEKHDGQKMDF